MPPVRDELLSAMAKAMTTLGGRGLHSYTFWLNVSAFYGILGAFGG